MLKKIAFLIFLFFTNLLCFAQRAPVGFKTRTVNFGKVKESTGKIYYDFIFFNRGEEPLKIERVSVACGCTAADFTPVAIPKDSSGHIKVSYNTTNRPGEINKTISIFFKGFEDPEVLTLKGIVIGSHRLIERELVYRYGNLRFQSSTLNFGTVRTGLPEKREYEFYNAGTKDIQLKQIQYDTNFMKVSIRKTILKPMEISKMIVNYDAVKRKDWGFVTDTIHLITSDDSLPVKSLPVIAHIEEYFPLKEIIAIENSPKIKFEKTEQHLGSVKEGATVSNVFKMVNEGKVDLQIRKIVPGCKCLSFETPKMVLKPGEMSTIKVTMDTRYREGVQNKNITVISNSPTTPSVNLWIRVNVLSNQ